MYKINNDCLSIIIKFLDLRDFTNLEKTINLNDYNLYNYIKFYKLCIIDAIRFGSLKLVKYLYKNTNKDTNNNYTNIILINKAVLYNQFKVVKYLYNNIKKCNKNTLDIAIINGNLDILVFFYKKNIPFDYYFLDEACKYGYLHIIVYFHETYKFTCSNNAIDYACEYNHPKLVKYLFENMNINCTEKAMYYASKNGNLPLVKYLYKVVKAPHNKKAIDYACREGHLNVIDYLFTTVKANYSEWALNWASSNGHINIVKYLCENIKIKYIYITQALFWAKLKNQHEITSYLKNIKN